MNDRDRIVAALDQLTEQRRRDREAGVAGELHGRRTTYARGCRCSRCRAAHAAYHRAYRALRSAEGDPCP